MEGVGDDEVRARVVEAGRGAPLDVGAVADGGQVLARHLDDLGVNLDHGGPVDGLVLEDLAEDAPVAAADDCDGPGVRVREEGGVGEGLVELALVVLEGLYCT